MYTKVTSNIDKNLIARRTPQADHALAIQAEKDTRPFVPSSGAPAGMMNRTRVKEGNIIYPGPYAQYLYFGKLMVDPATGSAWAKKGAKKTVKDKNLVFSKATNPDAQAHWFEASKSLNLDKWLRAYGRSLDSGL